MRALLVGLVLVGCGDNIVPYPTCEIGNVTTGATLEAISSDGAYLAYRDRGTLRVTSARCEDVPPVDLGAVGLPRFCGHTLVAFTNATDNYAQQLVAWNPGQAAATVIASDVDPGATHCSYDGRYFSTEADDMVNDGNDSVTLTLVPTDTLVPRTIDRLDKARGRFSHDSRFLVYSGRPLNALTASLWRLPLEGGTAIRLATIEHGRWEITSDDAWVVFHEGGYLRKCRLDVPGAVPLDDGVTSVSGRELALADDGTVVYLRTTIAPALELDAIPLDGGMRTVIDTDPTGAMRLLEHEPGIVFYTNGGAFQMARTTGERREVTGAYVADHLGDETLLLRDDTVLRVDDPSMTVDTVAEGINQVAFEHDGHAIGLTSGGTLQRLSDSFPLVEEEIGSFVISGDRHALAAIVSTVNAAVIKRVTLR